MIRFDQRGEPRLWAQDMMVGCLKNGRIAGMVVAAWKNKRSWVFFFETHFFSPPNKFSTLELLRWILDYHVHDALAFEICQQCCKKESQFAFRLRDTDCPAQNL